MVLTLPQQRLHYPPHLLPIPPTYKLNGSCFGRPDVDLMFAKWAFNNVGGAATMTVQATPIERLASPIRTCSEMAHTFVPALCKALIVACCVWLAFLLGLAS